MEDLTVSHNCCRGTVWGSDGYDVTISIRNGTIEDMSCTCPYARDEKNCKHMAALLFAAEQKRALPAQPEEKWNNSPRELVLSMSEADIRSYLTEIAQNNPAIYKDLSLRYGSISAQEQKALLLSQIDSITEAYTDDYDQIPYRKAYEYAVELAVFLENKPLGLLNCGGSGMVLDVVFYGLEVYCALEIDDSDGGTYHMEEAVNSVCNTLLEQCTLPQKNEIFLYLQNYMAQKDVHWIAEEIIGNILDTCFPESVFSERKLAIIEADLQKLQTSQDYWKSEALLTKKYLLLRNLPEKAKELEQFQSRYGACAFLRQAEIRLLLEEGKERDAVALIRKSREMDSDNKVQVRKYTEQLIEIYAAQKNSRELKAELLYHIRNFSQNNLTLLFMLKDMVTPEEWAQYRSEYLNKEYAGQRLQLLNHEKLWEELLLGVTQTGSLAILQTYEKPLLEHFPQQFFTLYTQFLHKKATESTSRKAYCGLMLDLKRLSSYPCGNPLAKALAAQWRGYYPRRRAMLEELEKAGF